MNAVYYEEDRHLPWILIWWHERGFPGTPLEILPPTGIVMEREDGSPVCAGFLYKTDGGVALVDHLVADPTAQDRSQALDILILNLDSIAREMGYTVVSGASNLPQLIKRYQRLGFRLFDTGVSHLAKGVEPCR